MDNTIVVSIIGGAALLLTNYVTAVVTAKHTSRREQKKYDSDLKIKIAEFAAEHPEKLLQIEKQLAIGIIMVDNINERIRRYIIPHNRIQIGRSISCDIVLRNIYISNEHCSIFSNGKKVYVEDLLSTNGTFVNRNRIDSRVELTDGDIIKIHDRVIEYKSLSN